MRQTLIENGGSVMDSSDKKFWIIGVIIAIVLAYPTWHYFIKDLIYDLGPVCNTPPDSLRNILIKSHIKGELKEFRFVAVKPALDTLMEGGRYSGPKGLRFRKTRTYLKFLEDILSRNKDKIYYHVDPKNKIVIISLREQVEEF
jgi:hypothetical protein